MAERRVGQSASGLSRTHGGGIAFHCSARYPGRNNIPAVGFPVGRLLRRLEMEERQMIARETLPDPFGNARDTRAVLDGAPLMPIGDPGERNTGLPLPARTCGAPIGVNRLP